MTQQQLAEACGWEGQNRISNYERGERDPDVAEVRRIAAATKVSDYWLLTGKGDMVGSGPEPNASLRDRITTWNNGDDLHQKIVIPRYEVWAAAGTGNEVRDEPEELQGDAYRAAFAREQGWSAKTHFSMRVHGDSMIEAGLRDGWSVVVDSTDTEPEPGEIYAIKYGDGLMVKFIEHIVSGGVRIISANRSHARFREPLELGPEEAQHVKVLGRVVHVQGLIGRSRRRTP